jgi:hypothetical protein
MHIWTDNPQREIWTQLKYLKSPVNMAHLLSGVTMSKRTKTWPYSEALDQRASEISYCIEQADQYFHASRFVGLATRPLMLFYGTQSLSKAVILANTDTIKLHDLRYHGLSSRPSTAIQTRREPLQNYADDSTIWTVEDEFAIINDGVFPRLSEVASNEPVKPGYVIRLKELLRITPELSQLYTRHYGEPSHALYLYSGPKKEREGYICVFFNADRATINCVFPEFNTGYEEVEKHERVGFRSRTELDNLSTFAVEVSGTVAGRYLVRRHPCGLASPFSVIYAGLFILSNIVRYKPTFWMKELVGARTGAAPLVEAFCNIAERRFPCEVLDALWSEHFTFGAPGYIQ